MTDPVVNADKDAILSRCPLLARLLQETATTGRSDRLTQWTAEIRAIFFAYAASGVSPTRQREVAAVLRAYGAAVDLIQRVARTESLTGTAHSGLSGPATAQVPRVDTSFANLATLGDAPR